MGSGQGGGHRPDQGDPHGAAERRVDCWLAPHHRVRVGGGRRKRSRLWPPRAVAWAEYTKVRSRTIYKERPALPRMSRPLLLSYGLCGPWLALPEPRESVLLLGGAGSMPVNNPAFANPKRFGATTLRAFRCSVSGRPSDRCAPKRRVGRMPRFTMLLSQWLGAPTTSPAAGNTIGPPAKRRRR